MSATRLEFRALTRLALPIVLGNVGAHMMNTVDVLMVGRFSKEALAAAGIAAVWIHGTGIIGMGLVMGMDPIVTQATGMRDGARAGRALQNGVLVALCVSALIAVLWMFTAPFLVWARQDPALAAAAHRYTLAQLPTYWCFLVFVALRQYLQARSIVRPILWITLITNVFNALFNGCLIYGWLGAPRLGLVGAGIASATSRAMMLALLIAIVWRWRLHADAWVPWQRGPQMRAGMLEIARFGAPIGLQMGLEVWAFGAASLMAGALGTISAGAHNIAINLASISFMIPLGVSAAACTRVGNLIGAGQRADAARAAWVAFALGGGVMAISAACLLLMRGPITGVYTTAPEVHALAMGILPIVAAFQIFDGIQVVGAGILRGMGDTLPAAAFNFVGYWVLSLPIGWWLAFRAGYGLAGVWWGIALGLFLVSMALLAWVRVRGPAHVST